jgi:hypothetical protein
MTGKRTGPVDPRLLHYTRGTRQFLVVTVVLGGITAALIVAQAWLIATTISAVVIHHRGLSLIGTQVALLAVVILGRAMVGWWQERMADRASASAKSEPAQRPGRADGPSGPAGIDRERPGSWWCWPPAGSTPSTATSPAICPSCSWP